MRLENFYQASKQAKDNKGSLDYGATHIQQVLIWLNFLDPPADGQFGRISSDALVEFQDEFLAKYPAK